MYCVYRHTTPSNKVYIGITKQKPQDRWQGGRGYVKNIVFYRAIEKYGWDNIKHEILLDGLTLEEAKQAEVELIAEHNATDRRYGYNITAGGDHVISRPHTEEEKQAARERFLGINNPKARPVICLETLDVYETQTEAARATGATKISECCQRAYKHRTSGGYHWAYYDPEMDDDDYRDLLKRYIEEETAPRGPISEKAREKLIERCAVRVKCVETGTIYRTLNEAAKAVGASASNICNCCNGKKKTTAGYHWQYAGGES